MTGFSIDISDMMRFKADVGRIAEKTQANESAAVMVAGEAYKTDVQAKLPWVTHTLIRSVHTVLEREGVSPVAYVGSNVPYARRIEHGFMDMSDKLGRLYHQPAQPVWRPVFEYNKAKYGNLMIRALNLGES